MPLLLHWLLCGTLTTQLKPIKPQNKLKKLLEGTALKLLPGLTGPNTVSPSFEKNDLPANFFCCMCTSPKYNKFIWLFNLSNIKHILTCFSKIKACMGVIYFLVCVRRYESNLPTNICMTVGKKTP